ncbi:hypothetical protein BN1080_01798 [Planococcus massiliensis]|uniref:Uncharacterized protein n=1 Tax=Planococcus massiliensis TaxID=1499687 RepID=A0A098EKL5_9BACL|nr:MULTISPECIES: hypothetical protein [Planococcus]MCJ1908907.1 hypothetical protein [Planococcus ruber]CEG22863.1 hypothetical protein BN1080_01798 [Planococcus massiliensis]
MVCISFEEAIVQKIGLWLETEGEFLAGRYRFQTKRTLQGKEQLLCSLEIAPLDKLSKDAQAANQASVYLLPDELSAFSTALWRHPIPFPTNFSQVQTAAQGLTCIQLTTTEPPEDFAKRLSQALKQLNGQAAS